jgi:hypothetical protein
MMSSSSGTGGKHHWRASKGPWLGKTEAAQRPEQTVGNKIDFARLVVGKDTDRRWLQKTIKAATVETENRYAVNENGLGLTAKKHEGNWNLTGAAKHPTGKPS